MKKTCRVPAFFTNLHTLCTGLNKGDAKHEAADVDTAPHVGLKMEATSTLQLNETNEIHGIILYYSSSIWKTDVIAFFY